MSGGQRTRLSLAQALYRDSDIYIFDDILSALDSYTGSFVMEETILKHLKGKTVIMSTHAIQYLKQGDCIYIMDSGRIQARGAFAEIVGCEMY